MSCALALGASACGEPVDTRPEGLMDESAQRACDRAGDTPTPITVTGSDADAVEIALSDTPYLVTLPEGVGYATIHTHEMHSNLAFYTRERDALTEFSPGLGTARPNGHCPTVLQDDFRVHIHNPGDQTLTFSADGPREILLIPQLFYVGDGPPPGHDGDGGPGHDHDSGPGHHHDHDGGHEHEHDAGPGHDHDGGGHGHDH